MSNNYPVQRIKWRHTNYRNPYRTSMDPNYATHERGYEDCLKNLIGEKGVPVCSEDAQFMRDLACDILERISPADLM